MNKTKSLHIQINFTSTYFSIQTWKVDKNENIQVQERVAQMHLDYLFQ